MTSAPWLQFLGVVLTALVMFGIAVGGWVAARGSRKASPYDVLERRVIRLEERLEDVETENVGLKRRVAAVIADRDSLVRYITIFRAWIAQGANPPEPRLPKHLADVIPAWVPGDGAEPPSRGRDDA